MEIIILILSILFFVGCIMIYNRYKEKKVNQQKIIYNDTNSYSNFQAKENYIKKEKVYPHVPGSNVKAKSVESNKSLNATNDSCNSIIPIIVMDNLTSNNSESTSYSGHGGEFGGGGASGSYDSSADSGGSHSSCSAASSCSSSSGSSCGGSGGD